MRRLRPAVALLGVVVLMAAACNGGEETGGGGELSGTTITFSISLAEQEKAAVSDLLAEFSKDTGAKVNLTSIASADLPSKLKVDVNANRPTVHLFAQDNLALRVLVDEDLVQEVADVEIPGEVIEAMVPEQFNGKSYFLPFRPNVQVAYANKERMKAAGADLPRTLAELRTAAEKLKAQGGSGKVTLSLASQPNSDPAAVTLSELVVSYGGNPLILNDEGSVKAYEFLAGMWKDGLLARESLLAKFDTQVDYLQGETAWLARNWPFTSAELAKQDLLDRFEVYGGWEGPARAATVIGGDVLGIPKGVTGDAREAAVALAEFLMSRDAQVKLAADNAWPSIRTDAYAEVPEEQRGTFEAIQAALENGWYRPNVPYWPDVSDQMSSAARRVMEGGEPVKAVLDEASTKIAEAARQKGATYPPEG